MKYRKEKIMNTTHKEVNAGKDELSHRFYKSIELLKEFRSTFLRWAVVESEGKLPSVFLSEDCAELEGATGILEVVFHGKKFSCIFKPQFEVEELRWTSPDEEEYDLSEYERLLFSIWDYGTGHSLERNEHSTAVWYIDDQATADRLEDIAERVSETLNTITKPKSLAWTAASTIATVKNLKPKWKPGRINWFYIRTLDEHLHDLESTLNRLSVSTETEQKPTPTKRRGIRACLKGLPKELYGLTIERITKAYLDKYG